MTDILMPALSPTMEEGVLAKWTVKEGDMVKSGDIIAEIETDKATMEVEAVDEGVVDKILVAAGTEGVKVNTPIARLRGDGESAAAPKEDAKEPPQEESGSRAEREAKIEKRSASLASPPSPHETLAGSAPQGDSRQSSNSARYAEENDRAPVAKQTVSGERVFASPLARRIAQQKGIELSALKGSGPYGRIVKADLENAKPGATSATQPAGVLAAPSAQRQIQSLEQMGIVTGSYDLVPLDGMRKTIARRMTESFRDIPHFPLTIDLEIDRLLDARVRINAALEKQGVKVSVNDIVIKACAQALKAVPEANASYTPEGLAMHHHADIAVAVALEQGLITPIIRGSENRSLADISRTMKDLAERARSRKLRPEEFQGGTFSVSNLGMMGIKSFASIINEPQGCILSIGAGEKRPVVRGDQLAIATVMSVTLTCDHRVVDGAIGSRWLAAFRGFIEDPVTMLA